MIDDEEKAGLPVFLVWAALISACFLISSRMSRNERANQGTEGARDGQQ